MAVISHRCFRTASLPTPSWCHAAGGDLLTPNLDEPCGNQSANWPALSQLATTRARPPHHPGTAMHISLDQTTVENWQSHVRRLRFRTKSLHRPIAISNGDQKLILQLILMCLKCDYLSHDDDNISVLHPATAPSRAVCKR